ncbi:MAG: hypothetical protein NTW52_05760 [Planctomycetota bacterium]|nr:hypothetical protein [Planctomycetota bacterium]
MANLWNRLFSSQLFSNLGSSKKARRRLGSHTRRALRMESLERRSLMAANVTGIAFTDVNDNGTLDVSDPRLGGITVSLFRDGGDGIFNNGTGDDVASGVTVTTASGLNQGRYSFNTVNTIGTYFVVQTTPVGQVQRPTQRVQTVVVNSVTDAVNLSIDDFNSPTTTFAADASGTNPNFNTTTGLGNVVGGVRDLYATAVAGILNVAVDGGDSNALDLQPSLTGDGTFTITYDGDGTNAANALGTQLGTGTNNFDLTQAGTATSFRLLVNTEAPNSTLTLRVSGVGGTSVTAPIAIVDGAGLQTLNIPFTSLVGTADLTQIGAIQFDINQDDGVDTQIDNFGLFGPIVFERNIANLNPMTIGNQLFLDRNNNGLLDGTDSGIGGVSLRLYTDTNANGILDPAEVTAQPSPPTTTSATSGTIGQYTFGSLLPGSYVVLVPDSQFLAAAPLFNHSVSPIPGAPPANNGNTGTVLTGVGIVSAVTLVANSAPVNDGDSDANTNLSRDFGFVSAPLSITKTASPTAVRTGDLITYTLTVTNNGPSLSTSTVISDPLPTGLSNASGTYTITNPSATGGTASVVSSTVTANVGTLAVGQIATVTIIATVGAGYTGTTANTATADNAESAPVTGNNTTPLVPNIDLGITKTIVGGATTVGVGGALTYRLTLTNSSAVTVTNIRVDDNLPDNFLQGTLPAGVTTGTAPADLIWTIATIAPNATATVDIPITVQNTATVGVATNTATIRTDLLTNFNETGPLPNIATVPITVEPRFDLLVTKDDGQTSVTTGNLITYSLAVNNSGPSAATNVAVNDVLPAQLQFVSANIGGTAFGTVAGQTFSGTIPTIASGTTTTVALIARVLANATGTSIANTVTITPANPAFETGSRPNTATDTNTLVRVVTLNIAKTGPSNAVAGGANFTYSITAFNAGSADAPNVLFSDPLPTGITFVSGSFALNDVTNRTGTVTFNSTNNRLEANLGTLLAGGSATVNRALITLTVNAAATATAGSVTNTGTLTSPDNTVGVTSSANTTVDRTFDVTVTKTVNTTTVASSQPLVYTIIVTNSGPSTATNVGVSDVLPSNVTFVSATSSSGSFTNSNGTVTGTIASLSSGSQATITLTATVNNNTPNATVITNPVTVTAAGESNTNNNSASASATVLNVASLRGLVYNDVNNNGIFDSGDTGIPNVAIRVSGTAAVTNAVVTRDTTTNSNGEYVFIDLPLGIYTLTQTQPSNFTSVATNPGTINGTVTGTGAPNVISNINLTANSVANNFGESLIISKRLLLASANNVVVGTNASARSTNAFRR